MHDETIAGIVNDLDQANIFLITLGRGFDGSYSIWVEDSLLISKYFKTYGGNEKVMQDIRFDWAKDYEPQVKIVGPGLSLALPYRTDFHFMYLDMYSIPCRSRVRFTNHQDLRE